ncbi:MAG: helix-turn-helix domain-containing protein [Deltaproteobacteria bacterium]|nr:MAG: helix-turn-helix domain-containing protein [Deltaproteobacteria bacterium]
MSTDLYSVEQVAERLGLHVRTVRAYIREGKLEATRVGKQYRISEAAVRALLGPAAAPAVPRHADASCVVELDGLDRATADRLKTLVLASAQRRPGATEPLRVQALHDEARSRLKLIIVGGLRDTADLLLMLDTWMESAS